MRCPDGVICMEQYTILFISFIVFFSLYFIYVFNKTIPLSNIQQTSSSPTSSPAIHPIASPDHSYTTGIRDTLLNPYAPPEQHNEHHTYKQVGYLKNQSMSDKLFPLFGKPSNLKRDKWNYYTIYDNIKVPVYHNNRNCIDDLGCDSLYNKDIVNIENLNETFNVSMYKNASFTYIPQLF